MSVLKPSKIYCTELHLPSDHMQYHVVIHEGYRQVLSSNAFFHGVKKHVKDNKRGIIWPSHYENEHHLYTRKNSLGFSTWQEELPVIEHESIWAFYEYIGYDYRTKKWNPEP